MNFKIFYHHDNLRYGLSEKSDGPMELANSSAFFNRDKFLISRGLSPSATIMAGLVHKSRLASVDDSVSGQIVADTDALISQTHGLTLALTVADCFPVYFYSPSENVIALAHCGWRGIAENLPEIVAKKFSNCRGLLVGIGPGIQACHFEVGQEVAEKFSGFPASVKKIGGQTFINLPAIISNQLKNAGVAAENIESIKECTFCRADKYFSFRRDKSKPLSAMLAYLAN